VRNGLVLAGAPAYWYRAFIGLVLVLAVIINLRIRRSTGA
jgi:simple sugar transport system permease protein